LNTDPEFHKLQLERSNRTWAAVRELELSRCTYNARLPTSAEARKNVPIATGCIDYFPDAIAAVAELSKKGNDQHNPGQPLHWDRSKSTDEADALMRHFVERGTRDTDGIRHSAKVAWRALALLQKEIESERRKLPKQNSIHVGSMRGTPQPGDILIEG
jgi:hypothetical protein